jgi:DNA repair protein RadC
MVLQSELLEVAEVQITYKPKFKVSERPQISRSQHAYNILMQHWDLGKIELLEEFKILLLNRRNRVLGLVHISSGGFSGTVADPKVIFTAALKACASGIILCHNHPSGELDPSTEDLAMTRRLKEAGKLLDLQILDHLIISQHGYYSIGDDEIL